MCEPVHVEGTVYPAESSALTVCVCVLQLALWRRTTPGCSSASRPTGERNAAPVRTRKTKSVFFSVTLASCGSTPRGESAREHNETEIYFHRVVISFCCGECDENTNR